MRFGTRCGGHCRQQRRRQIVHGHEQRGELGKLTIPTAERLQILPRLAQNDRTLLAVGHCRGS